jgi:hypothetical protein
MDLRALRNSLRSLVPTLCVGTHSPTLRVATISSAIAAALCLPGCSQPKFYPVRGKILIFAVGPLTQGEIHFRPLSRPSLIATGQIQKDGTFSVSTPGHGDGVLEGDCQVEIVIDSTTGKRPIAERYGSYSTSGLTYTITPRDENYFILDVKKSGG